MKFLSVFNHYTQQGGEEKAVELICDSLSKVAEVKTCNFFSSEWTGPSRPNVLKQALWTFNNPASRKRVRDSEKSFGSDAWLVHNILPVASLGIYPEAARLKRPIIQYVHNFRPFSVSGYLWAGGEVAYGGLSKNYFREIRYGAWQDSKTRSATLAVLLWLGHIFGYWRSVSGWIAISDFMRERFISAGVPSEKIFTLRHFWRSEGLENSAPGNHYLFLGRLVEAKGISVLLDAWERLERECGDNTPPLLICGDGPLRETLRVRAERLKNVRMCGQVGGSEKRELLRNAKAVVVPSISWEALGLTVYESFDFARPVLVARSGGLPELVQDQITGCIHEPGDAAQLAEHVLKLERDVEARLEMGRRARAWLLVNADEGAWQRRFLEIVAHVAGRAERPSGSQVAGA